MADEAKALGNAEFQKGNYEEAIKHFSTAIGLDANNHVLYSNRSACYASLKNFDKALEDADNCVRVNASWAKGYGRRGAALHGLQQYDEAQKCYEEGLKIDPANTMLKNGLADVEKAKAAGAASPGDIFSGLGNMFNRPDLMDIVRSAPQLAPYASQPDFLAIVEQLKSNPSSLGQYAQDPRVMQLVTTLLQMQNPNFFNQAAAAESSASSARPESPPPVAKEPERKPEPVKPTHEMTTSEIQQLPEDKRSNAFKDKGNFFYKKRQFDDAVQNYTLALDEDPKNVSCLTNRAGKVPIPINHCHIVVCIATIRIPSRAHGGWQLGCRRARLHGCYQDVQGAPIGFQAFCEGIRAHWQPVYDEEGFRSCHEAL